MEFGGLGFIEIEREAMEIARSWVLIID